MAWEIVSYQELRSQKRITAPWTIPNDSPGKDVTLEEVMRLEPETIRILNSAIGWVKKRRPYGHIRHIDKFFYTTIKPELSAVVGWGSTSKYERMRSSQAWDLVYRRARNILELPPAKAKKLEFYPYPKQ